MPDITAKTELSFTRRQQFWLATHGHEIVNHLICEKNKPYQIAFNETAIEIFRHYGRSALQFIEGEINPKNLNLMMAAFFEKTYPVDKAYQRQLPVMAWIAERYLNDTHNGKQILAEDLYKIGEDVRYFHALRDGGHIPPATTIQSHATLKDLAATLAPFEKIRAAKRAEHLERHIDTAVRNEILEGTTKFYDGSAGKIVLCHTLNASRYWGNNTKWCISAREANNWDDFQRYNVESPIIMFLPKDAPKMALVEGKFWDDEDISADSPSDVVERLLVGASSTLAPSALKFLEAHWPVPETPASALEKPDDSLQHLSQGEREEIERYRLPDSAEHYNHSVDPKFRDNKQVMMAAVQRNGLLLKHGSWKIKDDYDVVMAAVKQTGAAFREAGPILKQNRAIALQAIKEDEEAIRAVHYSLRETNFHIAALQVNPLILDELEDWPRKEKNEWLKAAPTAALRLRVCRYSGIDEDQKILKYQMRALKTLLSQGDVAEAQAGLRFIKPLWGQPERIAGDPAEQLAWLKERFGPRRGAAPQLLAA